MEIENLKEEKKSLISLLKESLEAQEKIEKIRKQFYNTILSIVITVILIAQIWKPEASKKILMVTSICSTLCAIYMIKLNENSKNIKKETIKLTKKLIEIENNIKIENKIDATKLRKINIEIADEIINETPEEKLDYLIFNHHRQIAENTAEEILNEEEKETIFDTTFQWEKLIKEKKNKIKSTENNKNEEE